MLVKAPKRTFTSQTFVFRSSKRHSLHTSCAHVTCTRFAYTQVTKHVDTCVAGDAIAINMPMTVHAVVIYLGIIYAGCAAVSIADSFAPSEISTRLDIAQTKAIFVQDVIQRGGKAHPLYERVVQAKGPKAIVLPAVTGNRLQVSCGRHVLHCNGLDSSSSVATPKDHALSFLHQLPTMSPLLHPL